MAAQAGSWYESVCVVLLASPTKASPGCAAFDQDHGVAGGGGALGGGAAAAERRAAGMCEAEPAESEMVRSRLPEKCGDVYPASVDSTGPGRSTVARPPPGRTVEVRRPGCEQHAFVRVVFVVDPLGAAVTSRRGPPEGWATAVPESTPCDAIEDVTALVSGRVMLEAKPLLA